VTTASDQAEILNDLAGLFEAELALDAWGRLLVSVVRDSAGDLRVADAAVEEVLDDARVDATFGAPGARGVMRAVEAAVEALCALEDVDPLEVGGATFVRFDRPDGTRGLAFLAGQVRVPSESIDVRREELLAWLERTRRELGERFGIGRGATLKGDLEVGGLEVVRDGAPVAVGRQGVLGTFMRPRRSWVWGAHNPSLGPEARARSARWLDALPDRTPWEITTQGFTTDEPTAWALAALVASHHGLDGVARVDLGEDGFVLLGVSDLAER
jgi:hypothetical protein